MAVGSHHVVERYFQHDFRLDNASKPLIFDRVLENVRTLPSVVAAGIIDNVPLGDGGSHQPIAVEGYPTLPMSEQPEVDVRAISPGYVDSLRIPLLSGRDLNSSDIAGRPQVALISASLAHQFWPNESPI